MPLLDILGFIIILAYGAERESFHDAWYKLDGGISTIQCDTQFYNNRPQHEERHRVQYNTYYYYFGQIVGGTK